MKLVYFGDTRDGETSKLRDDGSPYWLIELGVAGIVLFYCFMEKVGGYLWGKRRGCSKIA